MVSFIGGVSGFPFYNMNGFNGMGYQNDIANNTMNPFNVGGISFTPEPPIQFDFNDIVMMFNLLNSLEEKVDSNNGKDVVDDLDNDVVDAKDKNSNNNVNPFEYLFGNNFNPLSSMFPTLFGNGNTNANNTLPKTDMSAIQAELAGVLNVGKTQYNDTNSIYDVSSFVTMAKEEITKKNENKPKE